MTDYLVVCHLVYI